MFDGLTIIKNIFCGFNIVKTVIFESLNITNTVFLQGILQKSILFAKLSSDRRRLGAAAGVGGAAGHLHGSAAGALGEPRVLSGPRPRRAVGRSLRFP